jgi:hypothetical protein
MSNNKQLSSVEWFLDKLIEHEIIKIGQTTYGGKVNYKHEILFEQAKAMHKDEVESLNARWAKSREQTKDFALSIGVKIGFELALQHYEDYYEQLDKTDLDEDDFMRDYISKIDKQYKQ